VSALRWRRCRAHGRTAKTKSLRKSRHPSSRQKHHQTTRFPQRLVAGFMGHEGVSGPPCVSFREPDGVLEMRRIATILCVAAWCSELAYLVSLQPHLGPIVVNGIDIGAGLRPGARVWLAGALIGWCLGVYALLTKRRWEWAVLTSAAIFYIGWISTSSWGSGVVDAYRIKWMVARKLGMTGFLIRDVFMASALLIASLLAIVSALRGSRTKSAA
jgi:hypothetical protein